MGSRIQFISIIANWIWNCWIYTSCNIPVISNDNLQIYLIAYGRQINYKLAITNYSSLLRVFTRFFIRNAAIFVKMKTLYFSAILKSQRVPHSRVQIKRMTKYHVMHFNISKHFSFNTKGLILPLVKILKWARACFSFLQGTYFAAFEYFLKWRCLTNYARVLQYCSLL